MSTLLEKLKAVVEEMLDGEADLETLPNGHVCGHVISPHFRDKDYEDRRALIKQAIEEGRQAGRLDATDVQRISTLLTYTPEEWSVAITDTTD